ncbi:MAG: alpha-hydroxy-acid oxidizing enzyme [Legionellales bacterium]|nr:alpha-hydroxy-acid oxidizing enzyme [Legionellales bacterium]|tara:strand:- start:1197 stop:2372 length:1176 start_codon:yes stop_codon:yes gene_type:complete
MNDETKKNIKLSKRIFSIKEARVVAQKKLPKLIFDFVDGASGDEKLSKINYTALDQVRLEPKVLRNVEKRKLNKTFFNIDYDYPFGFAPMGMCNLTWPGADKMLANASIRYNVPTCVSMASTTSLEKMYEISKGHSWLQLYIFQDENFVKDLLQRAKDTGYKVLILTVDVAILSRRARDEKNGFSMPFKIGPRQFLDFATHPKWSLTTLLSGIPKPMNYLTSKNSKQVFKRKENRGSTDWDTLRRVRDIWKDNLIVKGIMSPEDAYKAKNEGVDAICVSNHGGRQLDCATASIDALPRIREKVGRDYPLIFDSGIRSGSDIIRALALGADFTMMGRPLMYGIGADQEYGLNRVLEIIREELNISLGLVGLTDINEVNDEVISKKYFKNMKY